MLAQKDSSSALSVRALSTNTKQNQKSEELIARELAKLAESIDSLFSCGGTLTLPTEVCYMN